MQRVCNSGVGAFAAAVLLGMCGLARGQVVNAWVTAGGGAFDGPANWSTGQAPTVNDALTLNIDQAATISHDGSNRTVDSIVVAAGTYVFDMGDPDARLLVRNSVAGVQVGVADHFDATLVLRNGNFFDDSRPSAQRLIGVAPQGSGTVIVGLDGFWSRSASSNGELIVGDTGPGSLLVNQNGQVSTTVAVVGDQATGDVRIEQDGILFVVDDLLVGRDAGGRGEIVVADSGQLQQTSVNERFEISKGKLRIQDQGLVSTANDTDVDVFAGGVLELAGGALRTNQLNLAGGSLDWTGGEITASGGDMIPEVAVSAGSELVLGEGVELAVEGAVRTFDGGSVRLDGGSLNLGTFISTDADIQFDRGDLLIRGQNAQISSTSPLGGRILLADGSTLSSSQSLVVSAGGELVVEDGTASGANAVQIADGGTVRLEGDRARLAGGTLSNAGLIAGGGRVANLLRNNAGGRIAVRDDQWLRFTSTAAGQQHVNSGELFVNLGTVEFALPVVNDEDGEILGRGEYFFRGGLENRGLMHLDAGAADVHGDVQLSAGSRTIVSAGGVATFFDDVNNDGGLLYVREGAAAAFVGTLGGDGAEGPGDVFLDGTLAPGQSPGLMRFGGDLTLSRVATTQMELAGYAPGVQYDQVAVAGRLALAGVLQVRLLDAFEPAIGDQFEVLSFGEVAGEFDAFDLAEMPGPLVWATSRLGVDGRLHVVSTIAGDANGDGKNDLADFNLLKTNFNVAGADWSMGDFDLDGQVTLSDFNILKENFNTGVAAPEPGALALCGLAATAAVVFLRRRR